MKVKLVTYFQTKKLLVALILLATLTTYWGVRNNDFILHDDDGYVTENRQIKEGFSLQTLGWAFKTFELGNWHPITWISHALDVSLFGLNPGWHHLSSLILHLFNVLLLFVILHSMTSDTCASGCVAALFALHPLGVDSVAWIAERKNLLCLFFGLLSIYSYVCYLKRNFSRVFYWAGLLCFVLASMSKPMLVTLPFVLLLLDFWPLGRITLDNKRLKISLLPTGPSPLVTELPRHKNKQIKSGRKMDSKNQVTGWHGFCLPNSNLDLHPRKFGNLYPLLLEKLPFFLVSITSCILTFWVQKMGGAVKSTESLGLKSRFENAIVSYAAYVGKIFWPVQLAIFYPHPGHSLAFWKVFSSLLLLSLVTGSCLLFSRRMPFLIMGWLWYLGTLVPVIGIVQVGDQAMADRYAYLPMIGIFIAVVWSMKWLLKASATAQDMGLAVFVFVCVLLALQTHRQLAFWKDSESLFTHALNVTHNNYGALTGLGKYAFEKGQDDVAINYFRQALSINPQYSFARKNLSGVLNNKGAQLALQGRGSEAIGFYRQALEISPGLAEIHHNLGLALYALGDKNGAKSEFEQTVHIDPNYFVAWRSLGSLLAEQGLFNEGLEALNQSLRIQPDAETYYQLGALRSNLGDPQEGMRLFRLALSLNPSHLQARQAVQTLMGTKSIY